MEHAGAAIIFLLLVLSLYFIYYRQEHTISEPEYALTSRGLNLPSRGGYYLGGLAVLDAAANADRTDQIILAGNNRMLQSPSEF